MTPQQEQQLRTQAKQRGYSSDKIEAFIEFAKNKESAAAQPASTQEPRKEGFIKSVAKDAFKTLLVKPGTRAGQLLAFGIGALTKNEQLKNAAFEQQDVNLGALGSYNIPAVGAGASGYKQVAGDALKAASYLYTPGGAAKAGATAMGGKILQAAGQGAKAGFAGGAAYGAGEALVEDKSAGEVAFDAAIGGAAGAAGGAILGGAGAAAAQGGKAFTKAVSSRLAQATGAEESILARWARQLEETNLRLTPVQRQKLGKDLDNVTDFILKNDISGTPQARFDKATDLYENTEDILQDFLHKKAKDRTVGKATLIERLQGLKEQYAASDARDLVAIEKQIDGQIARIRRYDPEIPVARLNNLKRSTYKNAYNQAGDKVLDEVEHDFGDVLRQEIENATSDLSINGQPLGEFNRDYGTLIKARHLLKIAQTRKEVGLVGRLVAAAMGGSIGSVFGPGFGTAVGLATGERTAEVLAGTAARSKTAQFLKGRIPKFKIPKAP